MIRTMISPLLSVREGAKAIDFHQAAFGARELRIGRFVDPYGHHWEIGKPLS